MLFPSPTPLFAAVEMVQAGWIDGLAPFVVLLVYIVRQVMSALSEQREAERVKREAAERGEPAPGPQPANADAGRADAAGDGGQRELRSEVEEFLRRVGQQRDEGGGRPQAEPEPQAAEPPRRSGPIDPFEEPPRRRAKPQPPGPSKPRPEPQPIELLLDPDEASAGRRASRERDQHRRQDREELRHLPESQLAEQAAHLGERIADSDDRVEARLHKTFDHRLGRMDDEPDAAAKTPEPAGAAGRIKKMLMTPGGVRDAVILSEVLQRRADRL